jgi:sugar/nucleoside kinase (ribokinase family)
MYPLYTKRTTQLSHCTILCHPQVAASSIVDTNGAGDAFVGGFLSQLVLGKVCVCVCVCDCVGVGVGVCGGVGLAWDSHHATPRLQLSLHP